MKTVSVCVVFAAVCMLLVTAEQSQMILTLNRVMHRLKMIQGGLAENSTFLYSPTTNDLKACCDGAALECFRSQVLNLTVTEKSKAKPYQTVIFRELRKKIIVDPVSTCKDTQGFKKTDCKSCESYPKVDSRTFVKNLETLLQKIYASNV